MTAKQHKIRPGDVIASKYRVGRVLGEGGMGIVVAAHHLQLDEPVALKFLLAQSPTDEEVARFAREARAAAKIKNEHVVRVMDVGQLDDGTSYMVMEYLEGIDLAGLLKQRGPFSVEEAVDFVLQACDALAEAHALGIVHRDLKPPNLFCIRRAAGPLIKVLDFGISKITTAQGQDITRTHNLFGSPQYMSPEQMMATKNVDARTDIWSLGVILFELLTGRPPFDAQTVTELAITVATQPAPALGTFRADVPAGLESVVARCLEKDRERRFSNVGELAVALASFGVRDGRSAIDRILGTLREASRLRAEVSGVGESRLGSTIAEPKMQTAAAWGNTGPSAAPRPSRGKRIGVGVAAGCLALLGAGALLVVRSPETAPATNSAPGVAASAAGAPRPLPSSSDPVIPPPPPEAVVTGAASAAVVPASIVPPPPVRTAHSKSALPVAAAKSSAAPPSAPPSSSADCNPPYTIDAQGHRVPRSECL